MDDVERITPYDVAKAASEEQHGVPTDGRADDAMTPEDEKSDEGWVTL